MNRGSRNSNVEECRVVAAAAGLFELMNLQSELERLGLRVEACASDYDRVADASRQVRPHASIIDTGSRAGEMVAMASKLGGLGLAPVILLVSDRTKLVPGVDGFIHKPLHEASVRPTVEVISAKWRAAREMQEQIARFERQLQSRTVIDSAKCLLMDRYGWRESESYRYLQTLSMKTRKPMAVVASRILAGRIAPIGRPEMANA